LLNCRLSGQIAEIGYHDWNKPESHDTCYYAEYNCTGNGYLPGKRPKYIHQLTDEEAKNYTKEKVLDLI
jgi:pectinesterase